MRSSPTCTPGVALFEAHVLLVVWPPSIFCSHTDHSTSGCCTDCPPQIRNLWRFEALRRVPLLADVDNVLREKLAEALEQVTYKAGQAVIQQGEVGDRFFIVEHGELGAFKGTAPAAPDGRPASAASNASGESSGAVVELDKCCCYHHAPDVAQRGCSVATARHVVQPEHPHVWCKCTGA